MSIWKDPEDSNDTTWEVPKIPTVKVGSANGNIVINNQEVKIYDDSDLKETVDSLTAANNSLQQTNNDIKQDIDTLNTYKTMLSRLGISGSNKLTIDGTEQSGNVTGTGVLVYQTLSDLQAAYPNGTTQPAWIIGENEWYYWTGEVTQPPADTTAPVLTITPAATFATTQTVTMSVNETATIYYTLDGSAPTTSSSVYSSALTLNATTTVKAFAKDTAGNSSAVQTVAYTLNATPPADTTAPTVTASPVGGTFTSSQNVTLSANETATIYYTVDGTTPTYPVSGTTQTYSGPIALAATTTLKFIGRDTAGNVSTVQTQTYTINIPASLATIVSDSFNRADSATTLGNAETGQTWSYSNSVSNPWGISSNQAYLVSGTNAFAFVDSGKADVEISATFPVSPTSSTVHNIIARYTDTNNHYMFQNNGSNILFYKRVSGTYTQLGTVANTPQANDVMKVSLIGSTITLFINGVQKAQWTDSTYTTQTKHGLQAGTNACRFDDFKIAG